MPSIRRLIDLTTGMAGLIIFAPVIAAMILLSRVEGRHRGLFKQTRYGLHGKPFTIYKISTLDGEHFKPLPITGLLRKVGLDELPQLINLIKGDMSLIGPRPHTHILDVPGWDRSFAIPPGVISASGIAGKILGVENRPENRAALENDYIDERLSQKSCLSTDMRLLFKAAKIIASGKADAGKYPSRPAALSVRPKPAGRIEKRI